MTYIFYFFIFEERLIKLKKKKEDDFYYYFLIDESFLIFIQLFFWVHVVHPFPYTLGYRRKKSFKDGLKMLIRKFRTQYFMIIMKP